VFLLGVRHWGHCNSFIFQRSKDVHAQGGMIPAWQYTRVVGKRFPVIVVDIAAIFGPDYALEINDKLVVTGIKHRKVRMLRTLHPRRCTAARTSAFSSGVPGCHTRASAFRACEAS
jgi:hypothetical protein